jgi:hypothetical protein
MIIVTLFFLNIDTNSDAIAMIFVWFSGRRVPRSRKKGGGKENERETYRDKMVFILQKKIDNNLKKTSEITAWDNDEDEER